MSFVVLYDANVLYPSTLRDLLIRIAAAGLVQAKWTEQILDEVFRNIRENRPDLSEAQLTRTRSLMLTAVRDCLVTGYEPLIPSVDLPDPDDRHVLAAAIRARAQVIVTDNLKDFPAQVLRQWDVESQGRRRLRERPDRAGRQGRVELRPADRPLLAQPTRHDRGRPRLAGALRAGAVSGRTQGALNGHLP